MARKVWVINMAMSHNPSIVTDGLVLCLDAGNPRSYPGSGTSWFDISGNGRHFTLDATYATWNSNGYFSVTSKAGGVFTGPASNSFGFASTNEHTIISWCQYSQNSSSNFFNWQATAITGTDNRAIQTHFPWNDGTLYYDVSGCCSATQRISSASAGSGFLNTTRMATWRTRTNTTPNREFFENTTSKVDSSTNSTATVTWNLTTAVALCHDWNGRLYNFLTYNRALSNDEITQNFNALRGRYGN